MIEEFSAGGIILRIENDQPQFLLINNAALKDPTKSYWGFPKGHLEKGESSEEAAIREVKEETGVEAEIVEKVDTSEYTFKHPQKGLIKKKVDYYLMRYLSGDPTPQDKELLDLGWYFPDDALNLLSFNEDKTLLKKALSILTKE